MVDVLGVAGLVVGSAGLIAGAAALIELPYVERLKKPELEIRPVIWQPSGPLPPMTFASAQVINKPIRGPLAKFVDRAQAEACEVTYDFLDQSSGTKFPPITGRWDSHPQPLKVTRETFSNTFSGYEGPTFPASYAGGTAPTTSIGSEAASPTGGIIGSSSGSTLGWIVEYDPTADTPQQEIPVGSDRSRISAAILKDGNAYAFANESYNTPASSHLCKREWKLTMGHTYRIEISIDGSNVHHKQAFTLDYRSNDFTAFRLQDAGDTA
jgi:hypothetical protein